MLRHAPNFLVCPIPEEFIKFIKFGEFSRERRADVVSC